MFRLDNILERWAELYTPLSHNSVSSGSPAGARKSFFRIGMIDAQSYFVRNYNMMNGCCMAYATHVDAELAQQNPKAVSYRHVIYFLAKQQNAQGKTDVTDEDAATEARFLTDDMVQDLLAVLWAMKGIVNGKSLPSTVVSGLPADKHPLAKLLDARLRRQASLATSPVVSDSVADKPKKSKTTKQTKTNEKSDKTMAATTPTEESK